MSYRVHDTAYRLMEREFNALPPAPRRVLDGGSYDVNGSLKPLVQRLGWEYYGLDVRPGANVAIVTLDPYHFPLTANTFDVVMCCCMMHNVAKIWLLLPEMTRVLKPGGALIVHAVWNWGAGNRHPQDYWRIQPDGMRVLFDECGCLGDYYAEIENEHDVIGRAWKQK